MALVVVTDARRRFQDVLDAQRGEPVDYTSKRLGDAFDVAPGVTYVVHDAHGVVQMILRASGTVEFTEQQQRWEHPEIGAQSETIPADDGMDVDPESVAAAVGVPLAQLRGADSGSGLGMSSESSGSSSSLEPHPTEPTLDTFAFVPVLTCAACGRQEWPQRAADGRPAVPTMQRCARCHVRTYCSPECASRDWPLHRNGCGSRSALGTMTVQHEYPLRVADDTGHRIAHVPVEAWQ